MATVTTRSRADWRGILRSWLKDKPRGYVFRSPDIYQWAQSNVPLTAAEYQKQGKTNREVWRFHLGNALLDLRDAGELVHPGCSQLAWMVP